MDTWEQCSVEVQVAYRLHWGENVRERLLTERGVKLQLLKGRFTSRHGHVHARLSGETDAIRTTVRAWADRRVAVRVLA